jgi:hypothetical protein
MTTTIELVDELVKLAVTHARLPAGSAAAHEANKVVDEARHRVVCSLATGAVDTMTLSRLRTRLHEAIAALDGLSPPA